MKKFLYITLIGFLSGLAGMFVGLKFLGNSLQPHVGDMPRNVRIEDNIPDTFAQHASAELARHESSRELSDRPDFVLASEMSTSSVVFITTLSEYEFRTGTMFDWFFEPRTSQRTGSGSGVVFSQDGYIVTNNHVVEDADKIKVTHGKMTYTATMIGSDPSTDLAVLKIESENLPKIRLGSSADVKVGEWVLAVGNPFNLTSTVTAGIVSAKGRNINILRDKFPIESFIQTDAAINPGNSGGALVNQHGDLIGINTAILSKTGSYAGYGFAIPVDIVKKVFTDIVKYGQVQKAFSGAEFVDIESEIAEKLSIHDLNGVLVNFVQPEGAAGKAGIKKGDVVRAVNGTLVENKSKLEEYINNLYPGDELQLTIIRDNKELNKNLTLLNREGETGIIRRQTYKSDYLGAEFEAVAKVEKDLLGLKNGVKVIHIVAGGFFSQLDIPKGFIITSINQRTIDSPEELTDILSKVKGRIEIYGVDAQGRKVYYPFYLR
ncbi:MAG: trypsin-like peptidase domain-containing protein [Cyclobacteriaceae bacterium]|nr:trypsin-like peptidase domain-containing protein [Cyclobacteriaceae bacterium]